MSRLTKVSNHVSPAVHEEVARHVVDGNNNRSLVQQAEMEFYIAKRLLAELPIVPTNERVYELVQDIQGGLFADLGDMSNCEQNWEEWVNRTSDVLKAKGILVLSRLKKNSLNKVAKKKKYYDKYHILQFSIDGQKAECQNDCGAAIELSNGECFKCKECGSDVSFELIDDDEVVSECCGCGYQYNSKLKGAK